MNKHFGAGKIGLEVIENDNKEKTDQYNNRAGN